MVKVIFIALCSVCLFLLKPTISLKCRTGVQQTDSFRKIVQVCKKRSTDNNYSHESSLSEDDNDDSSGINTFDTKFFLSGVNKFYNTQSWEDSNNNRNRWNDQRNGNGQRYSFNYTNGNRRNARSPNHSSNREKLLSGSNNNHNFDYSDGIARSSYDQMYNTNSENSKEREQACLIQCFFNELNIVDQKGFPNQDSIIQFMTHNLHNSELQDFIVEAIIECFHYLGFDIKQDKCYYSQNLLTCLNEKGKERCEDWHN
ncbi:General odorant-binding protein 71 [Formica fusca]